jgi:hypothetical protein
MYHWKKKFFDSTYRIYRGDREVGQLSGNTWKRSAYGEMNHKRYLFSTKKVRKPETEVIDVRSNAVIGMITYEARMTRATIHFRDRSVEWKYDNTWQTKWSQVDSNGDRMDFHGSLRKGIIECSKEDELLLLTGFFVSVYYWQMTVVVVGII